MITPEMKEATRLDELFSPVRRPKSGWQWEPNHYQKSMGLIPTDHVSFETPKTGKAAIPKPEFNVEKPPFGLDFERIPVELDEVATGYKVGGPKEARLFRVALLKNDREVEHLFPVKVVGIPDMIQEEELGYVFSKFGKVGNIYVPRDGASRKAVTNFAVVRFEEKAAADRALEAGSAKVKGKYCGPNPYPLIIKPLPSQDPMFTKNTGVHGMTNKITPDMLKTDEIARNTINFIPQNITLEECFSRSGYPWGSKAELRILEAHAPKETMEMTTIHITNLNQYTHPKEITRVFRDEFHLQVGDMYCPRPLLVHERLNDGRHNEGFGFIRFPNTYDMQRAMLAIDKGLVVIDGQTLAGEKIQPFQWPREEFRKYH